MSNFYRSVNPSFWSGKTGKYLRGNHKAQILALYLITNQHTNMQGVYHLPIAYICADTGLTHEGALKGLESLFKGGFCEYFYDEEVVFVYKMLAFQTGNLKKTDNRAISVCNFYAQLEEGQIKQRFAEHYWELLGFEDKPLASPLEAPRVSVAVSVTEAVTETPQRLATHVARPDCVSKELWSEFNKICKSKNKPVGELVLKKLHAEADKAGWTIDRALTWCCEKGYARFEAEWVTPKPESMTTQDLEKALFK